MRVGTAVDLIAPFGSGSGSRVGSNPPGIDRIAPQGKPSVCPSSVLPWVYDRVALRCRKWGVPSSALVLSNQFWIPRVINSPATSGKWRLRRGARPPPGRRAPGRIYQVA